MGTGFTFTTGDLELFYKFLPLIIPLSVAQLVLMIVALVHIVKHPHYKTGNMVLWIVIVLLLNLIGPILYFIIGRGEKEEDGSDGYS